MLASARGLPLDFLTLPQPNRSELLQWVVKANGIHHPDRNFSVCANLAVAHSGSSSLKGFLKPLSAYTHHLHLLRIPHLYKKGARCFITTLRDPVKRLQSSFDTEKRYPGLTHSATVRSRSRNTLWPWALVNAFRNQTYGSHDAVVRIYRESQMVDPARHLATSSMVLRNYFNGSLSLTPQVDYLDWLPVDKRDSVEIHVLCTHNMASDWQSLVQKIDGRTSTVPEIRANMGSTKKNDGNVYHSKEWLSLSRADMDFVRYVMFPYDTALLLAVCGPAALEGTAVGQLP